MTARPSLSLWSSVIVVVALAGCGRGAESGASDADEAIVVAALGTLRVANRVSEPIAIHLDGHELYVVPPGRAYTFRNLPTRRVNIYGVGRLTEKHYDFPDLTIAEGGEYEWTIEP